jgi:hypothetical protein
MDNDYIRAYSLGKRLSRARFMEKHAEDLAQQHKETEKLQKDMKLMLNNNKMNWKERARGALMPFSDSELGLNERWNLSNKRTVDNGVAMPSMQERYDSARDMPTRKLESVVPLMESLRITDPDYQKKEHYKILQDELYRRRHGGVGSYSRDLSTVQRDVDKLQEDVRNAYTPKLPQGLKLEQKQDQPPNQAPNFMSDRTPMKHQVGDLSEGLTLGRRPVNVVRPDALMDTEIINAKTNKELIGIAKRRLKEKNPSSPDGSFIQARDPHATPRYNYQSIGPSYAHSVAARFDRDTYNKKDVYEEGQQVNPSAYELRAKSDPRNPREGYTNPITAAHEYGHGEYGMDEVEADALAATTDYDMYDLADFYNGLTDYGENEARTEDTYADHEAIGDTHLPVAERMQLMAGNVDNTKMDKYYDRTER